MTIENAIKEIEHTVECCKTYLTEDDPWILALNIAISALRAQQTPPPSWTRGRWEGCRKCSFSERYHQYCPECGKPQTEEAWTELERRISGGTIN